MKSGKHNEYFWFQSVNTEFTIDDFLLKLKPFLVNSFVCITSFDSSTIHLTEFEVSEGWRTSYKIAISPKLKTETEIPSAGFDELYVFAQEPEFYNNIDIYVNYSDFNLDENCSLTQAFWENLKIHKPLVYLAEGTNLKIITSDINLKNEIENLWR